MNHEKVTRPKLRRGLGNRPAATAADDAAAAERKARRERVADARVSERLAWRAIGERLGISHEQARRDFDEWLSSNPSPRVEQVRQEEEQLLERLFQENRLQRNLVLQQLDEKDPATGKPVAARSERVELSIALAKFDREAVRISESRRRLHGADKPISVRHEGPGGGPVAVVAAKATLADILAAVEENGKD